MIAQCGSARRGEIATRSLWPGCRRPGPRGSTTDACGAGGRMKEEGRPNSPERARSALEDRVVRQSACRGRTQRTTHEIPRSLRDERRMSRRQSTGGRCRERCRTRLRADAQSCSRQQSPGSGRPGFGNESNDGVAQANREGACWRSYRVRGRSRPTFCSL
jgi:hypothetical protein